MTIIKEHLNEDEEEKVNYHSGSGSDTAYFNGEEEEFNERDDIYFGEESQ